MPKLYIDHWQIPLRDGPEVQRIITRLTEILNRVVRYKPSFRLSQTRLADGGTVRFDNDGGDEYFSEEAIDEIEQLLESFSPYVVGPAVLISTEDEYRDVIAYWIGSREAIAEAQCRATLDEVSVLLDMLTEADVKAFFESYSRKFK